MKLSKAMRKARKGRKAQGMTEYIIIVAVIAVAAIGAFGYFGQIVESQISGLGAELGGSEGGGATARGNSQTMGTEAMAEAVSDTNEMRNYDANGSTVPGAAN